jgi:benzoate/toluate 1,2-dioxygenase beta subunit
MNADVQTKAVPVNLDTLRNIENFLFEEAACLDEGRFTDWIDLFDEDGLYWVPGEPGQGTPGDALSLFNETKPLLALRMRRLAHPQTHVQVPAARTHHHVSGVRASLMQIEPVPVYEVHSMLLMAEWRDGEERRFSGRCLYQLRRTALGLRIVRKRVDLLNCDAPHRAIAVPF